MTDPISRAFDALSSMSERDRAFAQQVLMQAIAVPELATEPTLADGLLVLPKVLRSLSLPPDAIRQLHENKEIELWAQGAVHAVALTFAANVPNVSLELVTRLAHLSLRDARFLASFLENRGPGEFIDRNFLESFELNAAIAKPSGVPLETLPAFYVSRILEQGPHGWQLAEMKVEEQIGVYVGWVCGLHDGSLEILVVRSDPRAIVRYLARKTSTRELLTMPNDDAGTLLSTPAGVNSVTRGRLVVVSALPPTFLPVSEARHNAALQPRDADRIHQSFLTDSEWSPELFRDLERDFQTAFALTYFLDANVQAGLPAAVHQWLLDGFTYGHLYRVLRHAVPDNDSVEAVSLAAASPGVLTIEAPRRTAERVAVAVDIVKQRATVTSYRRLHDWSRLDELHDLHKISTTAYDDLVHLSSILRVDLPRLLPEYPLATAAHTLRAGKIVASYYRLLRKLAVPHDGVEFVPPDVSTLLVETQVALGPEDFDDLDKVFDFDEDDSDDSKGPLR